MKRLSASMSAGRRAVPTISSRWKSYEGKLSPNELEKLKQEYRAKLHPAEVEELKKAFEDMKDRKP